METTVFLNGQPVHTYGTMVKAGDVAPNFALVAQDLSEICLHDFLGKRIVLNIFPSLDTPVCAASVRRFNKEAAAMDNTVVICVSKDLPFADARFCEANNIKDVHTASAFRSDIGETYGVLLADGPLRGLLARVVIVIDTDGKVKAVSLCKEITEEPDYEFVKSVLK
ncbi:MAG: thiol peroxidase [Muribaculum sp.]|nr:thiol peroxidase [Muribaculum sp.]